MINAKTIMTKRQKLDELANSNSPLVRKAIRELAARELAARAEGEENAKAKKNLEEFSRIFFPAYQHAPHLGAIDSVLQAVESGKEKRVMIFIPPRHGKTMKASEHFPAWFLGRNPDKSIISSSYSQDLADDIGRKVRNIISNERYRKIFPSTVLAQDSFAAKRFHTRKRGAYFAIGVGGPITGRGADIFIIDDPIKNRSDANSAAYRKAIKDWYTSTAYTRLMPGGAMIIIQTRWHEDDLSGWLLKEHAHENWKVINMPAINDSGEALWPERYPLLELQKIQSAIGAYDWNALYMQRPSIIAGSILKRDIWKFHKDIPRKTRLRISSWDTAFKKNSTSDFTVGIEAIVDDIGRIYITDRFKARVEFPELKRRLLTSYDANRQDVILIEDKASGQSLIQELRRETVLPIKAIKVDKDKQSRAHSASPFIESGNVFLPESAPWVSDFIETCANFPNDAHDDDVDALTQLIEYVKSLISTNVNIKILDDKVLGLESENDEFEIKDMEINAGYI